MANKIFNVQAAREDRFGVAEEGYGDPNVKARSPEHAIAQVRSKVLSEVSNRSEWEARSKWKATDPDGNVTVIEGMSNEGVFYPGE